MTKREFLMAITEGTVVTAEMADVAAEMVTKMDTSNETRRVKMAEKAAAKEAEKAPMRAAILACITSEPKTATTLIEEAGVELKPQSIPSLLKPLVEAGDVIRTDIKVKGKGVQRGYVLA